MTLGHRAVWPYGMQRRDDLGVHLQWSARRSARATLTAFTGTEEDQLAAAHSLGEAVEHLAKAYLYKVNPLLIAEQRMDNTSMLYLAGAHDRVRASATEVRTIGAAEALKRIQQLDPQLPWQEKRDEIMLRVRNAAVHLGLVDPHELRQAVIRMLRLVTRLLEMLDIEPESFWTPNLNPVVQQLLVEAVDEVRAILQAKLAAARARFVERMRGLDLAARESVKAALEVLHSSTDHEEEKECPACKSRGWLLCGVEQSGDVEWDYDGDGGTAFMGRTAFPFAFECSVCGLELDGDEVSLLGFDDPIDLEPDEMSDQEAAEYYADMEDAYRHDP